MFPVLMSSCSSYIAAIVFLPPLLAPNLKPTFPLRLDWSDVHPSMQVCALNGELAHSNVIRENQRTLTLAASLSTPFGGKQVW